MIRVVLDANVLVSGFVAQSGTPATIIDRWIDGIFVLVLSEHILESVVRAWSAPYFADRYSSDQIQQAVTLLRRSAEFVVPDQSVRDVADDEEDDRVLGTAIAGRVEYLVTGDKGLQRVHPFRDLLIVSPREFLTSLDLNSSEVRPDET